MALPVSDITILARATGLAVAAVGKKVEFALLAGGSIYVGPAPGIVRDGLLQIGPVPARFVRRFHDERLQALFGGGVVTRVEAVMVEPFFECIDLCLGDLDFRFADL